MKATEAAPDVAEIIAVRKLDERPESTPAKIEALADTNVLSESVADPMIQTARFRNVLAHTSGDVIDHQPCTTHFRIWIDTAGFSSRSTPTSTRQECSITEVSITAVPKKGVSPPTQLTDVLGVGGSTLHYHLSKLLSTRERTTIQTITDAQESPTPFSLIHRISLPNSFIPHIAFQHLS